MEHNQNLPDDPIQPVLTSIQGGSNVLGEFWGYILDGGRECSSGASVRRARHLLQALRTAGTTAERIVADTRSALDQRVLAVRGCSALHERVADTPLCYRTDVFPRNLKCLHGGDGALDAACDLLHRWGLLPPDVADTHRGNLAAASKVAIDDRDRSLDCIARSLWRNHQRRPSDVAFWKRRFDEIGRFRDLIRIALLRVEPHSNVWRCFLYRREARALAKRRPQPITEEEMSLGFQEAGLPVGSYSR